MQRGRSLEDAHELVGVGGRQVRGGERVDAHPVGQQPRRPEGTLHRELLVEQHPDQQRERVAAQQFVSGGVLGDAEGRHTEMVP